MPQFSEVEAGLTLIVDTKLTAVGTFDVQNIPPDYTHLRILFIVRATNSTAVNVIGRFNNDSGSNYHRQYHTGVNATSSATAAMSQTSLLFGTAGGTGGTANRGSGGEIFIPFYSDTAFQKTATAVIQASHDDTAATQRVLTGGGIWLSTTAINRIQILPDVGSTFEIGSRLCLYGLR